MFTAVSPVTETSPPGVSAVAVRISLTTTVVDGSLGPVVGSTEKIDTAPVSDVRAGLTDATPGGPDTVAMTASTSAPSTTTVSGPL